MDLRARLKKLKEQNLIGKQRTSRRTQTKEKTIENNTAPCELTEELTGMLEREREGFICLERGFVPDKKHGQHFLGEIRDLPGRATALLSATTGEELIEPDWAPWSEVVFIDTETTGLAGGTGTYIFLVGCGYLQDGKFTIRQYFLSNLNREKEMLSDLGAFLAPFSAVFTFNGKRFDLPLLRDRFLFNRMEPVGDELLHFDLLDPARRLWGRRLESCALSCLEEKILGFRRENDIPGSEIPALYFDYLTEENPGKLAPVFEHNRLDIFSMIVLTTHLGEILTERKTPNDPLDLFSLAYLWERLERWQKSTTCYRDAIQNGLSPPYLDQAKKNLSFIYKKRGEQAKAAELWRQIISEQEFPPLYPFVELAKQYEHEARDYERAEETVKKALHVLSRRRRLIQKERPDDTRRERLIHRLRRIRRKKRKSQTSDMGSDPENSQLSL